MGRHEFRQELISAICEVTNFPYDISHIIVAKYLTIEAAYLRYERLRAVDRALQRLRGAKCCFQKIHMPLVLDYISLF